MGKDVGIIEELQRYATSKELMLSRWKWQRS
jgi:hypothetical protein